MLETGLGPAGISINRAGTVALVANRNDATVSIFAISGKTLTGLVSGVINNRGEVAFSGSFSACPAPQPGCG